MEESFARGIVGADGETAVHGTWHLFGSGESYNLSDEGKKYFKGDIT